MCACSLLFLVLVLSLDVSMVSGGADPSIRLWDLETRGSELDYLHTPVASVDKSVSLFSKPMDEALTSIDPPMNRHIHMP